MSKPNFLDFMNGKKQVDEAFNSAPYELTFGKKNAGDIFFTFVDEDEKEFRIQFYTPQGLGKNVRQVFIGQKKGSVYPDAISRFKNPMRVIASMIEATKQYLATPLGKTIDGFAVNFSKKALDRGMVLIPKIIRQSGLKQKLNVMDLTYAPVPDRGYVWLVRKGKDPAQVFDGPKMQGITWDDPDKVGDVPVQNNDMKPDDIEKIKSDALFDLLTNKDKNFQRGKDMSVYYYPINDGHISIICLFGDGDLSDQTVVPTYKIKGKVNSGKYVQGDRYNNFESASSGILKTCLSMIPNTTLGTTIIEQLKVPSNASIFGETVHGFSVLWKVRFPKGTKYEGANLITNVTFYPERDKAAITPMVVLKGKTLNNPRSYEIPLNKDSVQRALDGWSSRYDLISRELSHMDSSHYNPMGLFLDEIVVDDHGNVKWGNTDLGVSSSSGNLLSAISRETDRLEKEGGSGKGGKKTGADLAAYAGSIRDNAPQARDVDWQIYASRDGQTLNVDWSITFRRNTKEGAYQEYKAQITRANQYLQAIYQDAKAKGYNPTEPNLMTLDSARRGDEMTFQNGDSAYSEYEQAIGGNMQVKI